MPAVEPLAETGGLLRTTGPGPRLVVRVRGDGPAIVLLHGTSANHAVWMPVQDALAARATVVAVDQRGHGRSDRPLDAYSGADFADDVIAVLDALEIDAAIVGGHSLGGRNAWLAAARHPDRVSAALVVDYAPGVEAAVLDDLAVRVAGGDRAFGSVGEIEAYLHERYPLLPTDAVARRAEWGYRPDEHGYWRPLADPAAMQALIRGFREPYAEEFAAVGVPMTQLRGARSRILTPAAWAAARAARPGDRVVEDPMSDHYVPEENPGLVVAELDRLLAASSAASAHERTP